VSWTHYLNNHSPSLLILCRRCVCEATCHVLYLDFYILALILLYTCPILLSMCPHSICPHTVWQERVRGDAACASVQRDDMHAMPQRGSGGASEEELQGQ
jgi:hypothetical protein